MPGARNSCRCHLGEHGSSREPCSRERDRTPDAKSELFLKDVIDIKEDVHAGDFKIELSQGFSETDARVAESRRS
jgi:hypothetical protein